MKCENSAYLAEPVEESTAQSCSGGKRLATSSLKNTHKKSLRKESKMESSTKHQSLAMSEHSLVKGTPKVIKEWLMSLVVDSHASPLVSQEVEKPATMRVICGQPRWKLSRSSSHPLCTLRTCPDYSVPQWMTPQGDLFTILERYSETWPKAGMTLNGECWELMMSELDTIASGYGFEAKLPTPSAGKTTLSGELVNKDGSKWDGLSKPHSATTGLPVQTTLQDKIRYMPTPRANQGMSAELTENVANHKHNNLETAIAKEKWPTPSATDHKGAGKNGELRDRLDYAIERGATKSKHYSEPQDIKGGLNPDWVEWLMGWPIGATSLEPMSQDTYNEWLDSIYTSWSSDPSELEVNPIPRVTTKKENRAARLKAIGNGQVSLCMATAFRLLDFGND